MILQYIIDKNYYLLLGISLIICNKLRTVEGLPFFLEFLIVSNIVESIISPILIKLNGSNIFLYNIFVIICVNYYVFIVSYNHPIECFKKKMKIVALIITTLSFINIIFLQGLHHFNTITYNIGMCVVSVCIIKLFYDLIILDKFDFINKPIFYFLIGILIFYSAVFPILILNNEFIIFDLRFTKELYILVEIGNVILCLGYIFALLSEWRLRNL